MYAKGQSAHQGGQGMLLGPDTNGFYMVCLAEEIEGNEFNWLVSPLNKNPAIARQCGWITGYVY